MKLKNRFKIISSLLSLSIVVSSCFVPSAKATEFVITENGSGSTSEVTQVTQTSTEVSQTNTSEINNNVDTSANSGENTASGNTGGDVSIESGDTTTQVSIENTSNISVVEADLCCNSDPTLLTVAGNGSGSENTINTSTSVSNGITVDQNVRISNTIIGYANTGRNVASDNTGGSTSIMTGDIKASEYILNGPVNYSQISASFPSNSGIVAKISENGTDSENDINFANKISNNVFVNNYSLIDNYSFWYLNTGENIANDNRGGDVTIKTGDIDFISIIKNLINKSIVEITCCDPADPDNEDPDNEEEGKGGPGEVKKDNASNSENKIKAGDEAKAGGPGILGLSDTSGMGLGNMFVLLGLALGTSGGKMMYGEVSKLFKRKK